MTVIKKPQIAYTARDYTEVVARMEAYLKETRPEVWSDFFQTTLGQALIELNGLVGDMISYSLDSAAGEVFLSTMRRYESALRFARSVGYTPRSAAAAEVTVRSVLLPDSVVTSGGTVAAGTSIRGVGGTSYELINAVTIAIGATYADLTLKEGQSLTELNDPSSLPNQVVTTENGIVEDGSWEVFVGDATLLLNKWTQVASVDFETTPSNTYEISFNNDGKLLVRFGDGASGKIPDSAITINYRTTNGKTGNAPLLSVRGTIAVSVPSQGSASVTFVNTAGAASGGDDRESLDELRLAIPTYIRSNSRIVTLGDYDDNVKLIPGVALSFNDFLASSYGVNAIKVMVWDAETVTFTTESATSNKTVDTAYTRYVQLPLNRIDNIQAYLKTRTVVTVHNVIYRPTIAWADLYLSDVVYDTQYTPDAVRQGIADAVVGVFNDSTGFAIRLSDVYQAIDKVLGVKHFYIERVVFNHRAKSKAIGSIQFIDNGTGNNLQPADGDTLSIDDGSTAVIYEFDSDSVTANVAHIPVTIGPNVAGTLLNLIAAIELNQDITAWQDPQETTPVMRLKQHNAGAAYNQPILVSPVPYPAGSGSLAVTGMDGGTDQASSGASAQGAVTFNANPSDGDAITIGDGTNNVTFEFDSNAAVTTGNASVTIGVDTATTLATFISVITGSVLTIAAVDGTGLDGAKVDLTHDTAGNIGNVPISTTSASLTVTGMAGGQEDTSSVVNDMRRDLSPTVDKWPAGVYAPGSQDTTTTAWLDGGLLPYEPLEDLITGVPQGSQNFYDETYSYNNEIFYDSGVSLSTDVQAINLRRLVFDLVPAN